MTKGDSADPRLRPSPKRTASPAATTASRTTAVAASSGAFARAQPGIPAAAPDVTGSSAAPCMLPRVRESSLTMPEHPSPARSHDRPLLGAALAAAALAAAGCGSAPVAESASRRRPRRCPTDLPAGRVVPVGARPGAVAVVRGGRVVVRVGDSARLALVDGRSGRVVRRPAPPAAAHGLARHRPLLRRLRPAPAEPRGVAVTADGRLAVVVAGRERVIALHEPAPGGGWPARPPASARRTS